MNVLFQDTISQNQKKQIEQLYPEYLPHGANLINTLVNFFNQTSNYLTMIPRTQFKILKQIIVCRPMY